MSQRISVTSLTAAAVAWGSSLVMAAPALYEIAPVGGDTVSEGRAITPDGKYVVGAGTTGPGHVGDPGGFFWDAANGSRVVIDTGNTQAHELVGIGYRTYNANKEIIAFGTSTAGPFASYYITFEADAATGSEVWDPKLRRTTDAGGNQLPRSFPVANALAGTTTDVWYDAYSKATNQYPTGDEFLLVDQGSGPRALPAQDQKNVPSSTSEARLQGVSSTGLAVGWRKVSGVARNYVSQYDGDGGLSGNYFPNGLRANAGGGENRNAELWAVSANSNASDNRAGGKSEVDGRTGRWPFILDDFTGSDTGTATELPTFDNSEHGFATNGIVYGLSADGRYAVGMDYTLGLERAVLWDLDLMVELDLTQYAIDQGIIGDFGGNLRRAYAVGVNDSGEPVVTGWGFDDVEVAVRGFVLTVHDITGSLPCGLPFADDDRDGDVDQDDYGRFQACHTGQGPVTLDPGCACFDRDSDGAGDGDVDQDDWGAFEACASGPDVPVDPTCDDPAP